MPCRRTTDYPWRSYSRTVMSSTSPRRACGPISGRHSPLRVSRPVYQVWVPLQQNNGTSPETVRTFNCDLMSSECRISLPRGPRVGLTDSESWTQPVSNRIGTGTRSRNWRVDILVPLLLLWMEDPNDSLFTRVCIFRESCLDLVFVV